MTAPPVAWTHPATYVEPRPSQRPDGDTFRLRLDLGTYCGIRIDPVVRVRLAGIDTWEKWQPLGPAARDFTARALREARSIMAQTYKGEADETLGRIVAQVWVDGVDLADLLRAEGFEKSG